MHIRQTFQVGLDPSVVDPFVLCVSKKTLFSDLSQEFPELVGVNLIWRLHYVTMSELTDPIVDLGCQAHRAEERSGFDVRRH